MMDATSWKEKSQYFASPRQQGAGLINVANALRNEVVATFKNTDSKGLVNSYGSISLKEIKGDKKYFTIKLHNTSNRPYKSYKNCPTKYCTAYDGRNVLERKKSILCIT